MAPFDPRPEQSIFASETMRIYNAFKEVGFDEQFAAEVAMEAAIASLNGGSVRGEDEFRNGPGGGRSRWSFAWRGND